MIEYLTTKALDLCFEHAKRLLVDMSGELLSQQSEIQDAISDHLGAVDRWAQDVSFNELMEPKRTNSIYIPLDIYLYPRRIKLDDENIKTLALRQALESGDNRHFVLLGHPGAGKTTSVKFLVNKILRDETYCPDLCRFPVVLRLGSLPHPQDHRNSPGARHPEHVPNSILFQAISDAFGLRFRFGNENAVTSGEWSILLDKLVMRFLDESKALLILDGFDELPTESRSIAIREIRSLTIGLNSARVLLTSRTGEFSYHLDNTNHYEICALRIEQIEDFSRKWFGGRQDRFLEQVRKSPFLDTAMRPLTLALLCAIFERTGKIPEKPKTIYRKIIGLLLEEWDAQRSVERISRFANFEPDRKFDFLCALAFDLTTTSVGPSTVFNKGQLHRSFLKIHEDFGLKKKDAQPVIDEIESHHGLFLQSGANSFEFPHKSIQEYLTAEYLVRLPQLPSARKLITLPNELAIAVTISSKPRDFLCDLVFNRVFTGSVDANSIVDFIPPFLTRLLLEKPDFSNTSQVVVALLSLFTSFVIFWTDQSEYRTNKQINYGFKEGLESFLIEILSFTTKDGIQKYYRAVGESFDLDGEDIQVLEKTQDHYYFDFPSMLYASPCVVQEIFQR